MQKGNSERNIENSWAQRERKFVVRVRVVQLVYTLRNKADFYPVPDNLLFSQVAEISASAAGLVQIS